MHKVITHCRLCGNPRLISVLCLGDLALTGFFPKTAQRHVDIAPLELVKCDGGRNESSCGLLQLRSSYQFSPEYYAQYGYRSGLNRVMARHLRRLAAFVVKRAGVKAGDCVVDIGSNDATFLKSVLVKKIKLVGVDPSAGAFARFYPSGVEAIDDFFSAKVFKRRVGLKAKAVVSIAMFYSLESPLEFTREVYDILDDDGLWVFEQAYMPVMLALTAYDAICHEHLEYYALSQVKWIMDRCGFKIVHVGFNDINGGSFCVSVAKSFSKRHKRFSGLEKILEREKSFGLGTLEPYRQFRLGVFSHRRRLRAMMRRIKKAKKRVAGLGASTKGNVLLQFCGFSGKDVDCIGEVNTAKFGRLTPGSLIPICSEEEVRQRKPDVILVLPWHFRGEFLKREKSFLKAGGALLFPLPGVEKVML